ncbi:uncharacterized protein LOC124798679 [Schistocerca piceifrons]|uniref:uncharacterized protein LOC124711934 n=2 Tax=Schistocerca piceifrons TaxID=274613 RepID=UPI001F5ECF3F|nr:uncharacterized protein LOC124711934 [Schistocerca piceifrons]XP_047104774.1 uncharacterized protein LOC124742873 [Schistocerca piceifrons]XP_047110344.1 uncharacterized protein LOC124787627 [Schistocerca piceifrons]XP_047118136.1 uncharacterized protein LOC124798679 [Schistocerca piceifrons]
MEWSRQQIVDLIAMYQEEDCLWNVRSKDYKNTLKKHDALAKIATAFSTDKGSVEKKIRSLVVAYRREKRKIIASRPSGSGADTAYDSNWFGYRLLQFLDDVHEPKETTDTVENEVFVHSPEGTIEDEEVAAGPSSPPPPKIRRMMGEKKDMQQPFKIATQLLTKVLQKQEDKDDECSAYGQYVASVLRKLPELQRAKTMAILNNVLMKQHVAYLESEQSKRGMNVAGPSSSSNNSPVTFTSYVDSDSDNAVEEVVFDELCNVIEK